MGFKEYFKQLADEKFRERMSKPLRPTIRITRKAPGNILERLESAGYELQRIPRYDRGFWIIRGDADGLGNSIEYALGYLYFQEAASMIPPVVLKPQKGDKILDLCAAPGSKTTQMADMIENEGLIVANDVNRSRLRMLGSNVQRTSSYSVIVTRFDGRRLPKSLRRKFDKVLVDAPCSALGTSRRFPVNLEKRNMEFTLRISKLQYELLRTAIFAAKPGGRVVYSTCTLTVEENEMVVDRILKEFDNVEVESIDVPGLKYEPGITRRKGLELDERISRTARIYPRLNDTEGFYVASLIVKRSALRPLIIDASGITSLIINHSLWDARLKALVARTSWPIFGPRGLRPQYIAERIYS